MSHENVSHAKAILVQILVDGRAEPRERDLTGLFLRSFVSTYELFENRVSWITNSSLRLPGQLSFLNFFAGEFTHVLADGLD